MTTDLEKEREAFEAQVTEWGWNSRRGKDRDYLIASTDAAWAGWQARAALAAPAAPKGQPNMRECRHCGFLCAPNPNESGEWKPLAAPQEQPSDEEILQIFADVTHNQEEDARFIDIDRDQAIKIADILLSRYGAAPQGGGDAEPVAWPAHYQSEPAQIAVLRQNAVLSVTPGVDDPMVTYIRADLASNPQPAGRDAREVPSDAEIRTLIDDAQADWDESADQWNKWADLGQDERDEVIVRYALANFRAREE